MSKWATEDAESILNWRISEGIKTISDLIKINSEFVEINSEFVFSNSELLFCVTETCVFLILLL